MRSRSLLAFALAALSAAALFAAACSSDEASGGSGDDASTDVPRRVDGSKPIDDDGGADAAKDAKPDGPKPQVDGPGEAGTPCSFNRECQIALRCDEDTGYSCAPGTRGTGQNGVDTCDSGNQCASAVCVEGPPDSGFFCSDECTTVNDCTGALPQCTNIAFVGQICTRTPPN
jgi:hypothetical protein